MALSYEYSIGSVRAKETSLFTKADVEQFLCCNGTDELCQLLRDKGYGSGSSFEKIAEDHMDQTWAYLKSVAPDFSVFDPFLIQNDVHNFKVALKGTMSARDYYKELFITPCTIGHEAVINAVEHRDMRALPEWLQKAAEQAYDLLAHTGDAKASDAALDKAVMEEMLRAAQSFKSEFLKEYIRTSVFYSDVKIALRAARTGADKSYLGSALCEVEGFDEKSIVRAALKDSDSLVAELSRIDSCGCKAAMEEYKKSPSAFERFVDDRLMSLAKESCKRASEGAEPMLGYYLGEEAEKKTLQIIYSGIKTKTDQDIIRERMREIYG